MPASDGSGHSVRIWLLGSAIVAIVATTGSLYLSLGLGLVPCDLCWYQRLLMYPLVIVLGVGMFEGRRTVYRVVLPFSVGGLVIAGYHSWIQRVGTHTTCSVGNDCGTIQYQFLGLSTPNLAFIAFALISGSMLALAYSARE